jgi:tetratricopeptide (TPR) repeat protein
LSITDIFGALQTVILDLALSEKWVPVYIDKMSIIFVKDTPANREKISQFKMADDYVYNVLIYKLAAMTQGDRINPRSLISLGKLFSKVGRYDDAVKAYRLAAERWHDPDLLKNIEEMDAIIAQQGTAGSKESRIPQKKK